MTQLRVFRLKHQYRIAMRQNMTHEKALRVYFQFLINADEFHQRDRSYFWLAFCFIFHLGYQAGAKLIQANQVS